MDIALPERADAADGFVIHRDGISEGVVFIGGQHGMDVIRRIVFRIGIGQTVPQIV